MKKDRKVLRKLARDYFQIAMSKKNSEKLKLHQAVNDLEQIRPVVLIDELPWSEMNINDELTLRCEDDYLRTVERYMRRTIYKNKYMPADMVVPPFIPVQKVIHSTGIGISVEEDTLATNKDNNIVSHEYKDILKDEKDLEKIHQPEVTYNEEETMRRYNLLGEILGDILPVRITGINAYHFHPWDDIVRYHGVTNTLMDLAERPDFMHKIVQKFTDISLSYLDQIEKINMLDNNPYQMLHCTPADTSDLPAGEIDQNNLSKKDIWGRGAAQIFASVSNEMHDEFDIEYMKKVVGQCGLVYYGCCEPLHQKIDIVEKIPNLRKISITPWADVNIAAEAINTKYVLSAKPNPATVGVPKLNKDDLKKEIGEILDACRKNNCSCDIVLKDISSCHQRPENIFEWEQIVMNMVKNY